MKRACGLLALVLALGVGVTPLDAAAASTKARAIAHGCDGTPRAVRLVAAVVVAVAVSCPACRTVRRSSVNL